MRGIISKLFTQKFAIIGLVCVMVATVAVSFTYWKNGIDGNSKDKTLHINIGAGEAIETVVDLSEVVLNGDELIPYNREPVSGQTNKIDFTVNVKWKSKEVLTGSDITDFATHNGVLTVSCVSIKLGTDEVEVKDWKGLDGSSLFYVDTDGSYTINGNDASGVNVDISVIMREPESKEQYHKLAGQSIKITLRFLVESQYDLNNM